MAEKGSSAVQGTVIQAAAAPKFTDFAMLPLKMQMKIWKHAIPVPRLVQVHVRKGDDDDIRFITNTSVPALLSAFHTSRKIILEVYRFRYTYDFLLWIKRMKMREDIQRMFSGVTKLAMVFYTFSHVTEEQQRWFLSRFQSLKLYLLVAYCLDTDLDTNGDGIYLALQRRQLAILKQERVTDGVVYTKGCNFLESLAESALRIAKVDRKFQIVPALIGENKRKSWWE